jgi:hypothetical protein
MDYQLKKKREKIEVAAEKLFGNDILLKTVYIMTEMKTPEEEVKETLEIFRKEAEENAKEFENTLKLTLDNCGNIIEIQPQITDNISIEISN